MIMNKTKYGNHDYEVTEQFEEGHKGNKKFFFGDLFTCKFCGIKHLCSQRTFTGPTCTHTSSFYTDCPKNPTPDKKEKFCKHENNSCLDRASGIHCAEWELNQCKEYPDKTKKCQGCSTGGICGDRHIANAFLDKKIEECNHDESKNVLCLKCGLVVSHARVLDVDNFISRTLAEFDKNFPVKEFRDTGAWYACKEFLRSALTAQREEERKRIIQILQEYEVSHYLGTAIFQTLLNKINSPNNKDL